MHHSRSGAPRFEIQGDVGMPFVEALIDLGIVSAFNF